jgi:hypothetical protein
MPQIPESFMTRNIDDILVGLTAREPIVHRRERLDRRPTRAISKP